MLLKSDAPLRHDNMESKARVSYCMVCHFLVMSDIFILNRKRNYWLEELSRDIMCWAMLSPRQNCT